MIRISIEDKKYVVPNDFKELTIGKYQKLNEVQFENKTEMVVNYLSVLTGIEYNTIKRIGLEDLKKVTEAFKFSIVDEYPLVKAVKIKGQTFRLDENLSDMRFDMFIDLEEMTKDKDLVIDNIHLIMAILYRPAIKKRFRKNLKIEPYDSESVKERAEYFKKNMMMDKIIGALFFFINLRMIYIQDLADYLEQQKEVVEKN